METISINSQEWERLKLKLQRKYRELTDAELVLEPNGEDKMVDYLSSRLNRSREYVLFTLKKGLNSIENNRL